MKPTGRFSPGGHDLLEGFDARTAEPGSGGGQSVLEGRQTVEQMGEKDAYRYAGPLA